MDDIFDKLFEKIYDRVKSRVERRGLMSSDEFQSASAKPNPLFKNVEADLRYREVAGDCDHCKYMFKSLSQPALGWRVKFDFSSLESCAAACSLCSFLLAFIKQDDSFMETVKKSSKALRIVANLVGTITSRGTTAEDYALKEGNGICPQLTVTLAPDLDFTNVPVGMSGLDWAIHEDGILLYEEAGSESTIKATAFIGRMVKEDTDCSLLSSWLRICRGHYGDACTPNTLQRQPDVELRMIDVIQQYVMPAKPDLQYVALISCSWKASMELHAGLVSRRVLRRMRLGRN